MTWLIDSAVWLLRAAKKVSAMKGVFAGFFVLVFVVSLGTLAKLDLLPEAASATRAAAVTAFVATSTSLVPATLPEVRELPLKVEIPAIKLSTVIENPTSTDIELLDKALLKGAVRYPTSAMLGETGNVVLFGHSSYLPVVTNKAYQAFNNIQKLKAGDLVTVYASTTAYTYRVRTVEKESTIDAVILLQVPGRVLTLSTCDSFGAVTDRFVVTADFVESHPASS
ncbi:MAG: sortase [Patescibacteria group bacterium]